MAEVADVVIVGGGCTGSSIAYHLARQRAGRIILLERQTIASGTTGLSTAVIRQHYSTPVLADMAHRSLMTFERFDDVVGGEAGFRRTGLIIGARAQDLDALRQSVDMQRDLGIETRIIDLDALRALEPRMVTTDLVAACFEAGAGYADPVATTTSFARRARDLGVVVREGHPVSAVLMRGGRVRGVRLGDGTEITAGSVVMAANCWSVPLLRDIGLECPVRPSRHVGVLYQQPPGFGPQHAIVHDFTNGLYLRPEGANLTLVGRLDEPPQETHVDPDHYRTTPTPDENVDHADRATRRFPALQDATQVSGWAGIYDISPDWQPLLGPAPGISGLYCAFGFSGHGFKLSPIVGESIANMVLGRATTGLDLDIFRVDRFAAGALARGHYEYGIIG